MIRKHLRCMAALLLASQLGVTAPTTLMAGEPGKASPAGSATATPIKHVVVIFQENVSFDHYFATYPVAATWAKTNFVDHSITDQSSILRFIEDNWNLGRIGGVPTTSWRVR